MTDPFDRLRASRTGPIPDVDAIKARARGIEQRRYQRLAGGAVAIMLMAVVGIMIGTTPNESARRLATDALPTIDAATPRPGGASQQSQLNAMEADQGFVGTTASPGAVAGTSAKGSGMAAAAPSSESAASQRAADEAPPALQVSVEVTEVGVGQGARFTLRACNPSDQTRQITFPTGQRYDFEVSQDGELVWRWSDGRAFTQVYGQESWRPGECKTYNDSWDGRNSNGGVAPPGSYEAVGIVASSPKLRSAPKNFCLGAC